MASTTEPFGPACCFPAQVSCVWGLSDPPSVSTVDVASTSGRPPEVLADHRCPDVPLCVGRKPKEAQERQEFRAEDDLGVEELWDPRVAYGSDTLVGKSCCPAAELIGASISSSVSLPCTGRKECCRFTSQMFRKPHLTSLLSQMNAQAGEERQKGNGRRPLASRMPCNRRLGVLTPGCGSVPTGAHGHPHVEQRSRQAAAACQWRTPWPCWGALRVLRDVPEGSDARAMSVDPSTFGTSTPLPSRTGWP